MILSDTLKGFSRKLGLLAEPILFEGPAIVEQPEDYIVELFFPKEKDKKYIELMINSREREYCIQFVQTSDDAPTSVTRSQNIEELLKDYSEGKKIYVEGKILSGNKLSLSKKQSLDKGTYVGIIRVDGTEAYKFCIDYGKPIAESMLIKIKS
jgi:hypothetical protein